MRTIVALGVAALLLGGAARAEDDALHNALDAHANAPKAPPVLPDHASARAKEVQVTIAHGKKGEEERAAHAADKAADDNANRSAQGAAASAAKSANADSHAAAGQARAEQARGGKIPGSGGPNGHPGKKPGGH